MEVKYNVTGAKRKALVTALSEITNTAQSTKVRRVLRMKLTGTR